MKEVCIDKKVVINHSEGYYLICYFIGILLFSLGFFQLKFISFYYKNFSSLEFYFFRLSVYPVISVYLMKIKKIKFSNCLDNHKTNFSIIIRHTFSFLNTNFKFLALNYLKLSTCSIFTSLSPIFTCILSVFFLKEKFTKREFIGIIFCLTGSSILIYNEEESPMNYDIHENRLFQVAIGCIYGFGHSFFLSCMSVSNKIILNGGLEVELLLFFIGNLGMAFSILTKIFGGFHLTDNVCNLTFVLNVFFNGFICYLSDYLVNYSQKNILLVKSSSISYCDLVLSFFLGYYFLNESANILDLLGSVLIIGFNFFNILFPK